MNTHIVIMAGGKGTRMRSELPKVLHTVGGQTIIQRVLRAARDVVAEPTVVVGYEAEQVIKEIGANTDHVVQHEQRGTGHAVAIAMDHLRNRTMFISDLIVIPGDHPLVRGETLQQIARVRIEANAVIAMGIVSVPDFEGWRSAFSDAGRIVREDNGTVARIVERKDATAEELGITEVNVSFYAFDMEWLVAHIGTLSSTNAAKEYYLTDLVRIARDEGLSVVAVPVPAEEGLGVNSPEQLAEVEKILLS